MAKNEPPRKLTIVNEPGKWQRHTGEIIDIETMNGHHLSSALRLVINRTEEAEKILSRIRELQAKYGTGETEQGIKAIAEVTKLLESLKTKHIELSTELQRRPVDAS